MDASTADRYARLAQSWWLAAIILIALPLQIMVPAANPEPPPAGEFTLVLRSSEVLAALFLLGTLGLYWSWRHRLPPVTRGRWWGPGDERGRRLGFWTLWTFLALWSVNLLGLYGEQLNALVLTANPSAYLRPDPLAFAIETPPSDPDSGLIHLTLLNASNHRIPLRAGQFLGQLEIETPAGPYLMGRAQLRVDVKFTDALVATHPLPRGVESHQSISLLLPLPHWGAIRAHLPLNQEIEVRYLPARAFWEYQQIGLFEGPIGSIKAQ